MIVGRLPDSSLRAVPLGSVRPVIVASPAYLRRHGVPRQPDDIERHQVIGLDRTGHPFQPWVLRSEPRVRRGAGADVTRSEYAVTITTLPRRSSTGAWRM